MSTIDLGMPAFASLVPVSILAGIGILLVFRHASDQAAVRRAKSIAQAHLLEFRLFMDEPRLLLRWAVRPPAARNRPGYIPRV